MHLALPAVFSFFGRSAFILGLCRPGSSVLLLLSLKFLLFPSTRSGCTCARIWAFAARAFCPSATFLKIFFLFPSTRSGRAGPLLSGQQKVGKDWPKRAAPPLGFPLRSRWRSLRLQFARGDGGTLRSFGAPSFRAGIAMAFAAMVRLWGLRIECRR